MAPESVVRLVVPSSGITVALLEGFLADSEAPSCHSLPLASVQQYVHNSPTRSVTIPRPNKSKIPIRQTMNMRSIRPKLGSEELCHKRARCRIFSDKARNSDSRYVTNFKEYFDKIKGRYTCVPAQCPSLKQRFDRHKSQHHSSPSGFYCSEEQQLSSPEHLIDKRAHLQGGRCGYEIKAPPSTSKYASPVTFPSPEQYSSSFPLQSPRQYSISPSPAFNTIPRASHYVSPPSPPTRDPSCCLNKQHPSTLTSSSDIRNLPLSSQSCLQRQFSPTTDIARFDKSKDNRDNHSAQTKITFSNLGQMKIKTETDSLDCCEDRAVPLTRTETHHVLIPKPSHNYRDNLQDAIKSWLVNVPFYPNPSTSALLAKAKIVNELINKIIDLSDEFKNENYEQMLKYEIYTFLDALNVWYPGDKRDQATFNESLCEVLLERIRKLYIEGIHKRKLENPSLYNDCSRYKTCNIKRRNICGSNYSLRRNISSDYICESINDCRSKKPKLNKKKKPSINSFKSCNTDMEYEILDWINRTNLLKHDNCRIISKKEITSNILNRLSPYINKPMKSIHKIVLKAKICQILDELPISRKCNPNTKSHLIRLVDELADRLMAIQARAERNNGSYNEKCKIVHRPTIKCIGNDILTQNEPIEAHLKQDLLNEVIFCLQNIKLKHHKEVQAEITDVLFQNLELMRSGNDQYARDEIMCILEGSVELTSNQILSLVNCIIQNVKEVLAVGTYKPTNQERSTTKSLIKQCSSKILSVYTSAHEINNPSFLSVTTSIPKKKSPINTSKLGPEEQDYMNKLSMLIKSWMETLPEQFNAKEDKEFKEIIIRDLAEDIRDQVKLHQIAPNSEDNNDRFLAYFVFRWLFRLKIFKNLNDVEPLIQQLITKLKNIPVPEMTGNRQTIKPNEEDDWIEFFVPRVIDPLEEEIFHWLNEQQPSELYFNDYKIVQNGIVLDLAKEIKPRLANKQPISYEITQWLNKILRPEQKKNIDEMVNNLNKRIIQLPQYKTLPAKFEDKTSQREEIIASTFLVQTPVCCNSESHNEIEKETSTDLDETMKQCIIKYTQHNNNVHDSITKGAFAELLKNELQKLYAPTRKEVYDNFTVSMPNEKLSPRKFNKELQYVKDISDWLKNIPIETTYNTVGNKKRIEFVNNLAKTVAAIEDQRLISPKQDHDKHLESTLKSHMDQLPVLFDHKGNTKLMIDQLMKLIARRRTDLANQSRSTTNSTGISEQRIADFIEAYIRVHAPEIADDELAADAWSARLLKEVKKMVCDSNPNALTKAQVYERLGSVTAPGNKSLKSFSLKLDYAKEISDFSKSLPLLDSTVDLSLEISDFAEKISESEDKKADNSLNARAETELSNYIDKWLSCLPLDSQKGIVVLIVKQQLINRVQKAKEDREKKKEGMFQSPNVAQPCECEKKVNRRCSHDSSDPAGMLVKAIETFSNNLPIQGRNEDEIVAIKNNVATSLFQKVSELNDSTRCYKDTHLYEDMLTDEIDLQFDILPRNPNLQNQKQQLTSELISKIMEAKRTIKENAAGENYKKQLENTIESSMPNPLQSKNDDDPGFDIYKNRLASIFILENFDNGNDAVKLKYEKRIKNEIDKYFENALNRNAIPLSRDEIYDELYSSLFKVPVPNKDSIIDEVEEVKTRCEVDAWFEELPIREAFGVGELLERDQKLATLAKKLHTIEKGTPDASDKIHKEIIKWIAKLPLRPGEEEKVDELTKKLESRLKLTAEDRKCITVSDISLENKDQYENKSKRTTKVPCGRGKKLWVSPQSSSQQQPPISQVTPADLMLETVDAWANQIPIDAKTPQEKETIKEDLKTKILMKISELNDNPDVFYDDSKYDQMLDDELEKLFSTLQVSKDFDHSKDASKHQLKQGIRSIKPLIKEGKAFYRYKKNLKDIVKNVLKEPEKIKAQKLSLLNNLKDDIVDDFVEYNYNKDDDKKKQLHKDKLHAHLNNFYSKVKDKKNKHNDTLMQSNQLISELSKVSVPSDNAIREEVQVIRMKNEVENLFKDLSIPAKNKDRTQMKLSLAHRLNEIENTGHNTDNDQKMKNEIIKCAKKLGKEASPKNIDKFIEKLKQTEGDRKAAPIRKLQEIIPGIPGGKPKWQTQSGVANVLSNRSSPILSQQPSLAQSFKQDFVNKEPISRHASAITPVIDETGPMPGTSHSLQQKIDKKEHTSRQANAITPITEETGSSSGMFILGEKDCICRKLHQQEHMGPPGLHKEPFNGTGILCSTQLESIQPIYEAAESCCNPISISTSSRQDFQPFCGSTNPFQPSPRSLVTPSQLEVQPSIPIRTLQRQTFTEAGAPYSNATHASQNPPAIQNTVLNEMAPVPRTKPHRVMEPSFHQQPAGNLVRQVSTAMQPSIQMGPAQRTQPFDGAMKSSVYQQPAGSLVRQMPSRLAPSHQHAVIPYQASCGKYLPPINESSVQTAPASSYNAVKPSFQSPRQPVEKMGSPIESSGGQVEPWRIDSSGAQFVQSRVPAMFHGPSRYEPYQGAKSLFSSEPQQSQNGAPLLKCGVCGPARTVARYPQGLPAQSGATKGNLSSGTVEGTSSFQHPNDEGSCMPPQRQNAHRLAPKPGTTQGNTASSKARETSPAAHMVSAEQNTEQPSQVKGKRKNGLIGGCTCSRRKKRRRRRPYFDVLPYCDSYEFGSCLDFTTCPGFHYC